MKPIIGRTRFGSITVEGEAYEHDIVIRLDGQVKKRQKKLSKEIYGTSHVVSEAEAQAIYDNGAQLLIVGAGQEGMLKLSSEAKAFFKAKGCRVKLLPTPKATQAWNDASGKTIAMFHVTC